MKYVAPTEVSGSDLPDLNQLIAGAGGHPDWIGTIGQYMRAEATKLRPNFLYHFAKCIPFTGEGTLGQRLEAASLFGFVFGGAAAIMCMLAAATLGALGFDFASTFGLVGATLGCLSFICFYFAMSTTGYWIIGPGTWRTEAYDPTKPEHYAPAEVRERIERLQIMLPDAQFEISLLYQDTDLFDPVLWLVLDGGTICRPFIVWDECNKIVLPH